MIHSLLSYGLNKLPSFPLTQCLSEKGQEWDNFYHHSSGEAKSDMNYELGNSTSLTFLMLHCIIPKENFQISQIHTTNLRNWGNASKILDNSLAWCHFEIVPLYSQNIFVSFLNYFHLFLWYFQPIGIVTSLFCLLICPS